MTNYYWSIKVTNQSSLERDSAHVNSTCDLLMEMFEAQKIPADIAIVAMWQAILETTIRTKDVENLGDFIEIMKLTINAFDKAVPGFMIEKISKVFAASNDKVNLALNWIRSGPASIKIKNGEVVK